MDLEKFFDRVNHDVLMARVARVVKDPLVLRLIRKYLEAGMMANGVETLRHEGTSARRSTVTAVVKYSVERS
jgi:retron-type reverse transcriptase